jgi:NDP-sugar pyrophosphorylase family protein
VAVVGVIPAAGYATRLQPLSGSKEVIEVGGRPVIDYVIDRMRLARCNELRVVTRPEKTDVIAHVRRRGVTVVLGYPRTSSESFALGFDGLAPDDIVLLGWPDILWVGEDTYVTLVGAIEDGHVVALGLFETADDLSRWDTVTVEANGSVIGVHPKASDPPSTVVWAPAAARRRALDGLESAEWPGSHFDSLCKKGLRIHGIRFGGKCTDIGTKEDLERALAVPPV